MFSAADRLLANILLPISFEEHYCSSCIAITRYMDTL